MINSLQAIDFWIRKLLTIFCAFALVMMVIFTVYTVVMRYFFLSPPIWGDILTLFSNIWLVFLALALTVREGEYIELDLIYWRVSPRSAFLIHQFWGSVVIGLGLIIAVYGYQVAMTNPGKYWELNYLPKKYPLMILPLTGLLVTIGALVKFIEDCISYYGGTFKRTGDPDSI